MYHIVIQGKENQLRFLQIVGGIGEKREQVKNLIPLIREISPNVNTDTIPKEIWGTIVKPAKEIAGMSWRTLCDSLGMSYCGNTLFKSGLSRKRLSRVTTALYPALQRTALGTQFSSLLFNLSCSDIFWDTIDSIEPLGVEEVYDATVPGFHNFVANDFVVHNSLEQDADIVMFIYRKDRDRMDLPEEDQNVVELIVAKHRNGPLGSVKLRFDPEKVTFHNIDVVHSEEGQPIS